MIFPSPIYILQTKESSRNVFPSIIFGSTASSTETSIPHSKDIAFAV
ncbi:hypothetical protein MtrunA17_Chr2g0334211 [Medicago truncatula]|uniref:Uncharacterized protein n=1 Tax=Medicago truncatula TaxID=3880 RepID=A0A396JIP3_MEDTR|nr:hypothetical protein MtrunA17_Chr2g0334211 [Medicago truncatula]